jgi:NAD(P)-dependent dehydrogenase (short-subunit alcohol dehydrogenase family)
MNLQLEGRTALVTGASMGIGRGIALAFGRFGADLAVCDRDEEHLDEVAGALRGMGRRVAVGVLDVRDTNYCRIHACVDERTGKVFVFAAIDNLWKGASSQAVQNLNLMFDIDETVGLL